MMYSNQRSPSYLYNTSPYAIPAYETSPYQVVPLDINWYHAWSKVQALCLSMTMIVFSTAILSLDIANVAIERNKQNGTSKLGSGTGKVGAGIWTGMIAFITAVFIFVTIFRRNKRTAATFALFAVILTFCFTIVLIGLTGNAIQNNFYLTDRTETDNIQNKILIAILSLGIVIMLLCIVFFIMYIKVFFSPSTRPSSTP